jgi:hypothetical protein
VPTAPAYWIEKGRLPQEELAHIDYGNTGQALKAVSEYTRRKVTKHSSGYCAVNKWMFRWKKRPSSACPRCEEICEDTTHVWHCQGHDSSQKWTDALLSLKTELDNLHTDPVLSTILLSRLRTWQAQHQHDLLPLAPAQYQQLVQHQDAQGWNNFFMGLPSMGWAALQNEHYKRLSLKNTGRRWLIAVIRKQWMIAWDIWNYRNSFVHDNQEGAEVRQVRLLVQEEYAKGAPSQDTKKFFKLSLEN